MLPWTGLVKTGREMLFIVRENQMLVNSTITIHYSGPLFDFKSLIYFPLQFLAQSSVFAQSQSQPGLGPPVVVSRRSRQLRGSESYGVM